MKFDLSNSLDQKRAQSRLSHLIEKQSRIELTEYTPKRTNLQNRYFHACCGLLSEYSGYTKDEVKIIIKEQLEFMVYVKNGHKFLRHTAELDKNEFIALIDFTRSFGESHGCYLPTPEEFTENQFEIEKMTNL